MAFRTHTVDYKMKKLCNVQKLVGEDGFEIIYTPLKKFQKKYWFYSYFYPLKQKLQHPVYETFFRILAFYGIGEMGYLSSSNTKFYNLDFQSTRITTRMSE